MQLKRNSNKDIVFEWIPYSQLNNVEEISKSNLATIYSAIWNNGPLHYEYNNGTHQYTRNPDKKVALKYIHNLQNITNELLNEV